jgi:hypothetical protein
MPWGDSIISLLYHTHTHTHTHTYLLCLLFDIGRTAVGHGWHASLSRTRSAQEAASKQEDWSLWIRYHVSMRCSTCSLYFQQSSILPSWFWSHTHTHTHMLVLLTHVLYRLWEMYTTRLPWSDCNLEQMTTRVVVQVSCVFIYIYRRYTFLFLIWQHYSESCYVLCCQNERPPIPKDMPREYSDVVQRSWHREPRLRPEFSDVLPVLRELHEALNPGSKLSSASSVGSGSSTATVVSLVGHSSTRAQVLIWLDFFLC